MLIAQLLLAMLKPKSQGFRLKVMLNKLEASSNKVVSRCIATFKIDGEDSVFKATPQLRKNVALFNSEVQFDNFSIYFDEITGLYENKQGVLVLEIETQGTRMKLGEVAVNLGGILNQKKYRIVNTFPLNKCYDKTAKVKLSVDFIPLGPQPRAVQKAEKGDRREVKELKEVRQVVIREGLQNNGGGGWKQLNYKSRLAEESNSILQQKLYEYQQKMDNYRLSQAQMQEKLHDQINKKDEQITELTMQLNRRNQQLTAINLQNQQLRFRVKQQNDEIVNLKDQIKGLLSLIEGLTKSQDSLKKEVETLRASIDNQGRTRDNKEKYYSQQLAKYTARYMESEQERNKIIFELQTKFKQEMQKKEAGYRGIIAVNDKKNAQMVQQLRQKIKKIQDELANRQDLIEKYVTQGKRAEDIITSKSKEIIQLTNKYDEILQIEGKTRKAYTDLSHQLQTLNFSYNEVEREVQKMKQQLNAGKRTAQQLKMEIVVANQTIEEQRRNITKFTKELQVHKQREYFLTEKYNEEMEIKSINEDNIRGESLYFRDQINKVRGQLRIAEERAEEESSRADELANSMNRLEIQLANRGQTIVRMGEERLSLESEVKTLRNQIGEMEEILMSLKEQNLQLSDSLRQKRSALESDKTLEWSYKIQQLQADISEMVQKFKVEKDAMREGFKREDAIKRQEISQLTILLRKAKEEVDEIKNNSLRRENSVRQLQRGVQELRKQLRDKTDQYQDLKNQLIMAVSHHDQLEKRLRLSEQSANTRIRQAQINSQKEIVTLRKTEQGRVAYQKVIHHLLDFLTRPMQSVVTFQEIPFTDIQLEFANLVNISLRKHCEERQKIRDQLKKNEISPLAQNKQYKRIEIDRVRSRERFTSADIQETYASKTYLQDYEGSWRERGETQELRAQNSRLKREVSQLRVKMRSLQQQVSKAERAADNERSGKGQMKRQLQEVQEELDKANFQLKRKEKVITQFQGQLKDLQGELIALRNSHAQQQTRTPPLSRSEVRMRQKEEAQSNSRKDIIIRDLQSRLQAKFKEIQEILGENTKLKNENTNLKQSSLLLSNEVKLLESKLKQRNARIGSIEKQLSEVRDHLEGQLHSQSMRHKKELEAIAEELIQTQEQNIYAERTNQALRAELEETDRRAKALREQNRVVEAKNKKDQQLSLNRLKQHIAQLQTSIITLKSEMEQMSLRYQQLTMKNGSLAQHINRKNTEIQNLGTTIKQKQQKIYELQEQLLTLQQQTDSKMAQLRQIIQDLQEERIKKQYQMEEFRFTTEGRIMDLQKKLQDSQSATNTFKKS